MARGEREGMTMEAVRQVGGSEVMEGFERVLMRN